MSASQKPERIHWLVRLISGFQILVILGFLLGIRLFYQDFQFSKRAVTTQAEIVDIQYRDRQTVVTGASGGLNTYPVFLFTDQNGVSQTVKPTVAMEGRFSIGETRSILFDPANPSHRVQLVGWNFYTGVGGIVLLVTAPMAALFIWGHFRQKTKKNQQRLKRNESARSRRARKKAEKLANKKD